MSTSLVYRKSFDSIEKEPWRVFFEQSPVGFGIIDPDFLFLKANPAFCRMLGYDPEEMTGLPLQQLLQPRELENEMHLFCQLLRGELDDFEIEKRCIRRDGINIWLGLTFSLMQADHSDPTCYIVIGRDIAAEKIAEEQRRAQARIQRNTLIREVNHRIKNNIQGVIGLLRYQSRQNPELGRQMQQAIERLQAVAIVHGTQGISRLGNCSLVRMVSQICDSAQLSANGRQNVKLQILAPNDVIVVEGESVPTALIVNELVANAMKHGNIRKSPVRVTLNGDKSRVFIRIENAASGRDIFRMESGNGLGAGLGLVRSLLPPCGASLSFKPGDGEVLAELLLTPPVIG